MGRSRVYAWQHLTPISQSPPGLHCIQANPESCHGALSNVALSVVGGGLVRGRMVVKMGLMDSKPDTVSSEEEASCWIRCSLLPAQREEDKRVGPRQKMSRDLFSKHTSCGFRGQYLSFYICTDMQRKRSRHSTTCSADRTLKPT